MKLLTAEEVAGVLRLSTWQIYELARRGVIPHVHVGRCVRFREDTIDEWTRAGGSGLRNPSEDQRAG